LRLLRYKVFLHLVFTMTTRSRHHRKAPSSPEVQSPFFDKDGTNHAFFQPGEPAIQAKLTISQPGDVFEQEADRVADTVVNHQSSPQVQQKPEGMIHRQPMEQEEESPVARQAADKEEEEPPIARQAEKEEEEEPPVARQAADKEEEETPIARQTEKEEEEEPPVARQMADKEEEETPIQTKANDPHSPGPLLSRQLNHNRGQGQPLPASTHAEMSNALGYDFSDVTIHTDAQAVRLNQGLKAQAFTQGKDIYFNEGKYDPTSRSGKHLLAHELTHVVQQKGESERLMRDFRETSSTGNTLEVITTPVEASGGVRFRAAPRIISTQGDRVPYRILATVTNRPFDIFIGIRRIATGEVIRQQNLIQNPSHRNLQRWQGEGIFRTPPFPASLDPGSGVEFYVRLEPSATEPVEYSMPLSLDVDGSIVELSRVLHAESGGSLIGMVAVANVIQNRIDTGFPPGQIDTANPWPTNFVNTGYFLNRGRPRSDWPRITSTASRSLARIIIENGRTAGSDPTFGARFYRAASAPGLEKTNPTFMQLSQRVNRGELRRVTVGGNVFYAPN
jgi:hypothetical protein